QTYLQVVLYVEPYGNLVEAVVKSLEEVRQVWELDTFLTTPPPSHTIFTTTHHHHATTTLCVAIIVLADLQSVGRATKAVQRGRWFQGSHKQVLAYTGASLNLHTLTQHPYLGSGYGIVVVSWWPREENALTQHHHQQQEEKEENEISGPRVYHLLSPCPYCRDGGAEVVLIDEWQPGGCGFVLGNSLYPDTFKNFQGHRFNIVTLEYAPFSCYDKASDGGAEEGEVVLRDCVDTRILNALASTLNFTYNIREPRDHQWGYRLDNGTYTGVIGAVEKYEADFSLNVAFTGDREKVIDYTVGYFYDPLTFCTTKPRPLNQVLALIRPFQPLSCRWSGENGPRVLVAAWLVFSMVTLTSYVAMLTASLTLPTLSPTLNSLEQLVESDFSWGIQVATGERQLHVATNDFFPSEIGWAMNPGCPFRGKFNQQIRRLLEGGLITKWLLQIINDPKRREVVEGEEVLEGEEVPRREGPQRLGLDQLQGVFYILILGDIIASLLFVVEFYKHSP
ncbi:Ionotropic receptor 40a-like 5, partial [Homarus americanus]